jgi:hypothetical protein
MKKLFMTVMIMLLIATPIWLVAVWTRQRTQPVAAHIASTPSPGAADNDSRQFSEQGYKMYSGGCDKWAIHRMDGTI